MACIEVEIRHDQFFSKILALRLSTDTRSFDNFLQLGLKDVG